MDDGRLWNIRNAFIDKGKRLVARWGIGRTFPANGLTLCDGWFLRSDDNLCTFAIIGTAYNANGQALVVELDASGTGNTTLKRILSIDPFGLFYYVVAEYGDGSIAHHFTDVAAPGTRITDANCPHTRSVTVAGNRIFAIATSGLVRFSALGAPRDWTSATASTGAGFLPVTSNQGGAGQPTAVGQFQQDLAVFFKNAAQLWFPDVIKENMFLRQRIYNHGTKAPLSVCPFADDLAFVSAHGIRTVSIAAQTTNRFANDLGAPVDDLPIGNAELSASSHFLVYPRTSGANVNIEAPAATFSDSLNQLWVSFGRVNESQDLLPAAAALAGSNSTAICVLTYSRASEIAGWTLFHVPYVVRDLKEFTHPTTGATTMRGLVSTNATAPHSPIFVDFSPDFLHDTLADNSTRAIAGEVIMPFLDNEQPGIEKQFSSVDLKARGAFDLSAALNPNTPDVETVPIPIEIEAETAPDGLIPFEVSTVSVSPALRFTQEIGAARASQLTALQLYYDTLGPV